MKTVSDDLIDLSQKWHFDLIAHGCNCHCTMGSDFAKGIKAALVQPMQRQARRAAAMKTNGA